MDDFTNSGSTLFKGATLAREKSIDSDIFVGAFVSHYVAQYKEENVKNTLIILAETSHGG